MGVPEQALGWFPLGLGLVVTEDEASANLTMKLLQCHVKSVNVQYTLSPQAQLSGQLKYSDPKRVLFDSMTGQGIVYNVVVKDTTLGTTSSYIPGIDSTT